MAFDVYIEHSKVKVGYMLAKDQTGLIYRASLAPELSDQVRQDNYSYGHIPPQVAVFRAWEDWSSGAGFDDTGDAMTRYNHSRGVNASYDGRLYLSFARQALLESDASAIGAAPAFYSRTSDGVFLAGGQYIYEYVSAAWLERRSVAGTVTGPIVDFNGTQFAPYGDSTAYAYSTDGATWTTVTTLADLYAQFFLVRGQSSGAAVLWKISSTGALKNNTSGLLGGGAWSAATQIGGTGETVGGMVVMNDDIVVFKTDGIYAFDGTTVSKVWDGGRLMYAATNGSNPTIWVNNKVYAPYGNALLEYDNSGNDPIRFVWPRQAGLGNDELNGTITALAADIFSIYFALKNSDGNTYIMAGDPDVGFHTWAYLGANDCNALAVAGPGDVHASNPVLLIGYATAGDYFILPRTGLLPEDDTNCRFDTAGGYIVGSYDDVNARGFTKFLNSGIVLGRNLATGRTVKLGYEADASGASTDMFTASANGKTEKSVDAEVEFNRVRYRVDLATTGSTVTPIVEAAVFSTTLNNPRKRLWEFAVEIAPVMPVGGGDPRSSLRQMESHLFAGKNKRLNFYDLAGTKHRARILDINGISATRDSDGINQVIAATLVEI